MEKINIIAIVGSDKADSSNLRLIKYIKNEYSDFIDLDILDYYDLDPYYRAIDNKDLMQANLDKLDIINKIIDKSEKIIISSPEYDRSPPARLLNLLEWFSFEKNPLVNKECLILSASNGRHGGNRGLAILRQVLESPYINASVFSKSIHLGKAFATIKNENFIDNDQYIYTLDKIIKSFLEIR